MKKLMGVLVVGLLANAVFAAPAFDILGTAPIQIDKGLTKDVWIATTGAGTVGGMELYLQTSSPAFEIVALKAADIGGLFVTGTNVANESIYVYPDPGGLLPNAQYAVDFLSTTGDLANVAAGAVVAKVTIKAVGDIGVQGTLTTGTDVSPSNFAKGDTGQDTIALEITPEPMSALLLVAGLPLLRRRRA